MFITPPFPLYRQKYYYEISEDQKNEIHKLVSHQPTTLSQYLYQFRCILNINMDTNYPQNIDNLMIKATASWNRCVNIDKSDNCNIA